MTHLPFMSLPVPDLLAETGMLDTEEFGAYALLLLHMWSHEAELPNDNEALRKCARLSRTKWRRIKPRIWGHFQEVSGSSGTKITHSRLRQEYERAIQKRTMLALNGAKGGRANALKSNKRDIATILSGLEPGSGSARSRARSASPPNGVPPIPIPIDSSSKDEPAAARHQDPKSSDATVDGSSSQPNRLVESLERLEARGDGK